MKLSGLIIETSSVHSTKSARPLSIVKFEFQGDNGNNGPAILLIESALLCNYDACWLVNERCLVQQQTFFA